MRNIANIARKISGKGRSLLTKGAIVAVLVLALVAISRYDGSSSEDATVTNVHKRMGNPNAGNGALNTKPQKPWNPTYTHNPCYYLGSSSNLRCGPAVYVIGIQYGGLNILRKALDFHPKIDCYSTEFWRNYTNMEDIQTGHMNQYFKNFENSTDLIEGGADLCICDSGPDLARPYGLNVSGGITYPPSLTTVDALVNMYENISVLVITRDPVQRFIREYCALNISDDFEAYVDQSIADFVACENDGTRDDLSCVYDETLSPLLQAGLYFPLSIDLNNTVDNVKFVEWSALADDNTRNATLIDIYNFLDKGTPDASVFDAVAALFVFDDNACGDKTIQSAAKTNLTNFYYAHEP